jgi:protein-disulfide isomerase
VKIAHLLTATALAVATFASQGFAATTSQSTMSLPQQQQLEKMVHDYLVNHPEVLVEASQALQQKQQQAMQTQAQGAIAGNTDALLKANMAVAGNAKGDVTLIEFFDYQCIHCKKMKDTVANLIAKNKDLRVVYKEFPIFGKNSELASQAVLAAGQQGKYLAMQEALLKLEKPITEELVMSAAKTIGLNVEQLKKDMASPAIKQELADNRALAEKMHLMGTPAFVILSTPNGRFNAASQPGFVPGGASEASLQQLINQAKK